MKLDFFVPELGPVLEKAVFSFQMDFLETYGNGSKIPETCGVYLLLNKSTKCFYIGSTAGKHGFRERTGLHYRELRSKKHYCRRMQVHYNKWGPADFLVYLIEITSREEAVKREQYWLDVLAKPNKDFRYNRSLCADSVLGMKKTKAQRLAQAEITRSFWLRPGFRENHIERRSHPYAFEKDGKIYEGKNLTEFCRQHNLVQAAMLRVLKGQASNHHGWTIPGRAITGNRVIGRSGRPARLRKIESSNGEIFEFSDASTFCKEHNLPRQDALGKVINGKRLSYLGWHLPGVKIEKTTHKLQSPGGQIFEFENVAEFSRLHGLNMHEACAVLRKEHKTTRGWHIPGINRPVHRLVNPQGQIIEFFQTRAFAKSNNLNLNSINNVIYGNQSSYQGWTKVKESALIV